MNEVMRTIRHRLPGTAFLLLCLSALECLSAPAPMRLGVVSLGAPRTLQEERAFHLMEKRVTRWLENREDVPIDVTQLSEPDDATRLRLEADVERLLRGVFLAPLPPGEMEGTLSEVRRLRGALQKPHSGPLLQKALLAEAAYLWKAGEVELAEREIRRALTLHPEGTSDIFEWDGAMAAAAISFEALLAKQRVNILRTCTVSVSGIPPQAAVTLNGFDVSPLLKFRPHLKLASGEVFRLTVSARGYLPSEKDITCSGFERKQVSVSLKESVGHALETSPRNRLESYFLIQQLAENFRFFLYTPGKTLDEIPMRRPLRLAEVVSRPLEDEVPISSDAFGALFRAHQPFSTASSGGEVQTGDPGQEMEYSRDSRWYNSWKFWALTGSVAAVVLVGFLAARSNQGANQNPVRIQLSDSIPRAR